MTLNVSPGTASCKGDSYHDYQARFLPFVLARASSFDPERFEDEFLKAIRPFLRATVFLACQGAGIDGARKSICGPIRSIIKHTAKQMAEQMRGKLLVTMDLGKTPYREPIDFKLPLEKGLLDLVNIMDAKLVVGRFFMERMLPETALRLARIASGADTMMSLEAEMF